jgi:hypothetical protein
MLNNYFLGIVGLVSMAVIFGCGSTPFQQTTTLDKNWGRSFESAKYNQIIDHKATKNRKPVTGLDGVAGENNMGNYRKSFAADTPSPEYNINLSGIGGGR